VNPRTLVVGARTARQGTGRFLAGALAAEGADVCGLVGTTTATAEEARAGLADDFGIEAIPYTDLSTALASEAPELVLLASPWQFHESQLQLIADADCHCLVEKPMLWPGSEATAESLIEKFANRGRLLDVVGQWPFALAQFAQLHDGLPSTIASLRMRLSPISIDDTMIPDAAPHFISLLQALAGPGNFRDVTVTTENAGSQSRLTIDARYQSASGDVMSQMLLETVPERPRPAWFEINGLRAERRVTLPDYAQTLFSRDREVNLPDPMASVASAFLERLRRGESTDVVTLLAQHRNLRQLATAA